MYTNKIRHIAVALGLVAVAVVTGASAAGFAHRVAPAARSETLPVPAGDLGEVIVHAPRELSEAIVHASHDLGEVLVVVPRTPPTGAYLAEVVVTVPRTPVTGAYLAEVVVTVPREGGALYTHATEAAATLAAVQ